MTNRAKLILLAVLLAMLVQVGSMVFAGTRPPRPGGGSGIVPPPSTLPYVSPP